MATTPDPLTTRINELNAEFDKLMINGRQVPRRMLIGFGYEGGYADGYQEGMRVAHEENRQAMEALLVKRGAGCQES